MTPEAFFENFAYLADAPNGVQKLRELILQLAVCGKLVPQDSTDEPAGILLARIRAEKARLVKEKRIRKTEPLPPVSADEAPYELPQGWEWVRAGMLFSFVTSGSRGWAEYYSSNGPIFLRIGNLDYGTFELDLTNIQHVSPPESAEGTRTRVQGGDLLVSITGDTGMIGLIPADFEEAFINQHIALARPCPGLMPSYLALFYMSPLAFGLLQGAQRGIKNSLGLDDIRNVLVSLPPFSEQQRIVAKVAQLMVLCNELEARQQKKQQKLTRLNNAALDRLTSELEADDLTAALELVRDSFDLLYTTPETIAKLRQCILQLAVQGRLVPQEATDEPAVELLERIRAEKARLVKERKIRKAEPLPLVGAEEVPYELPQGWAIQRFAELADIVGGVTKGRNLAGRKTALYPYLRVANVQRGYLNLAIMKEIEIPVEELAKYMVCDGDLLITEGGDWDKVGRTAIWNGQIEICVHQNHVFRARVFTDQLSRYWVMQYINSTVGRRYFENASKQTTNLASINMTQLRYCPIPIPPVAEQNRIIAKVNQLMALCDSLEVSLTKANAKVEKLTAAAVTTLLAA